MAHRYPNALGHTIRSAARELGIDEGTVRRAVSAGDVKSVVFGNVRRITFEEVSKLKKTFKPKRAL